MYKPHQALLTRACSWYLTRSSRLHQSVINGQCQKPRTEASWYFMLEGLRSCSENEACVGARIQVCLQTSHLFHATDLVGYYDHCVCDLSHLVHQFRLVLQTPLKCSCAVKEKQYHTTENCITLQTCEMRPP